MGYDENLSIPQSQPQNLSGELGDIRVGGSLRCLYGKVDTTISCTVYMYCLLHPVIWMCGLRPWCYGCYWSVQS